MAEASKDESITTTAGGRLGIGRGKPLPPKADEGMNKKQYGYEKRLLSFLV